MSFDPARLARIPAFLTDRYVAPGRLPHGAIMVSRGDADAYLACVGDARDGQALAPDAIFRIASMTKPVASLAFLMLVEEGRVALSDPVANIVPELSEAGVFVAGGGDVPFVTRPPARPMRMVDLLRHTAGLTYGFQERTPVDAAYRAAGLDDFHFDGDLDQWVARLARIPLQHDPGAAWNYSVATDVLGLVIQRIEGRGLDAVLADRILAPLDMVDTGFGVPAGKVHRLPDAYAMHRGRPVVWDQGADSRWSGTRGFLSAGGGLVSTLADYHRFARMLLGQGVVDGRRLVSRKTIELMGANHLPGGGDLTQHSTALFSEAENAGVGFGLGVAVTHDPAATMLPGSVGELYWGGMFSTGFFVDPVERIASVFMTQLMPSSTYAVRREIKTLVHAAIAD